MRKTSLAVVAVAAVVSVAAYAATDPTPSDGAAVSARIRKVTVYSERARITRGGTITLAGGRQRIFVPDLPVALDDASVSASFPGSKTAKILSIEVETTYGKQTSRKDAEVLIEKGKALDRRQNAINDDLAALSAEENFLRTFQVKTRPDEKGRPVPISLEPIAWQTTLGFVSEGLANVLARERAKQLDARNLQKERDALNVELAKVQSYQSAATKRVALEVEGSAGAAEIEVIYAIAGPSWRPAYDVRVLSSTGKVEILTQGVVRQQTGEDWKDVEMTLSTAAPEAGADLPQLLAWRLGDSDQFADASASGPVGAMNAGIADRRTSPPSVQPSSTLASRPAKSAPKRDRARAEEKQRAAQAPQPVMESAPMEADVGGYSGDEMEMDAPAPPPPGLAMGGVGSIGQGRGGSMGGASIGGKNERAEIPMAPPATIRAMGPNVWSLPAGHAFHFENAANPGFSWSGDQLYCPSPVVSAGGFDFAFKPERKSTVLSDGRERKVRLTTSRFPAELLYEVVAPVSTKAYLRATIINTSKQPFLAGESFVFLDEDFVGRAFINTVASTQKLELSLGVDDDVKVERRLEQTAENTGVFTKKERTVYTTLIGIKSFKKRAIDVLLRDQVPVTWQKDDITVETMTLSPQPADEKGGSAPSQGLYAWRLSIPASGKQDVKVKYAVEHPRDFDLYKTAGGR